MFVHHSSDNAGGHERKGSDRNGFHHGALGYNIHNYQPKEVTTLKVVAYLLGLTGTGWLFFLNVGGWKAQVLWVIIGLWWIVQIVRACMKLYFEYKHEQIELQEKKARYNKDIFT